MGIKHSARMYFKLAAMSVKSQLRYGKALSLSIVGQFFITAIEFAGVYALFARFGSFKGWSLAEVAFLYGFVHMIFALADAIAYGFDSMGSLLKTGNFDRFLVRPLSPIVQLLGYEFTLRRIGRFTQGLAVFCLSLWMLRENLAVIAFGTGLGHGFFAVGMLLVSFVAGTVLFVLIFLVQAAYTFRTVEGLELMNSFSYGGQQAAVYPFSGYRFFMKMLFIGIVPIGAVVYLPVCLFFGKEAFPGFPLWLNALGPLMVLPFGLLAALLWRAGLRRYASGGG